MEDVFLLLGSNLGNRRLMLQQALSAIAKDIAPVLQQSVVYQTKAWGKTDEPDYLNQVLQIETNIEPLALLSLTQAIEVKLGRIRKEKWGARLIDIDILFFGDLVLNEPGLVIPHPQLHLRKFTLQPLADIAPKLIHPVLNITIEQLNLWNTDVVNLYS